MSTVWLPSLLPGYTLKNPGILRKTCENLWKPDKLISCHCGWVTWPLCTKPHRELFGSLKAWSIHQHHCCLLQRSAALKFALLAKSIDFLFAILPFCFARMSPGWQKINISSLPSQQLHILVPDDSGQLVQLFHSRKLLLASTLPALLWNRPKGQRLLCSIFINKDSHRTKFPFLFPWLWLKALILILGEIF